MDTFTATRSFGPQDLLKMGDEWSQWVIEYKVLVYYYLSEFLTLNPHQPFHRLRSREGKWKMTLELPCLQGCSEIRNSTHRHCIRLVFHNLLDQMLCQSRYLLSCRDFYAEVLHS
jgi:hypothetical protein